MPISETFNEDNMLGMARYPDKYFDVAIVDPNYGILKDNPTGGGGALKDRAINTMSCKWDELTPPEYFKELFRVSKDQIIWGGNYFDLPPTRGIICWDKMQPWENFSQWEMAWTSFDKPAAIFRYRNAGDKERGGGKEKKIHPCQKPVRLYSWLLSKYTNGGNKIIDTHMGSQTSRIAAYKMGFDYWGWEWDPHYFNEGQKKFLEQTAQLKLL